MATPTLHSASALWLDDKSIVCLCNLCMIKYQSKCQNKSLDATTAFHRLHQFHILAYTKCIVPTINHAIFLARWYRICRSFVSHVPVECISSSHIHIVESIVRMVALRNHEWVTWSFGISDMLDQPELAKPTTYLSARIAIYEKEASHRHTRYRDWAPWDFDPQKMLTTNRSLAEHTISLINLQSKTEIHHWMNGLWMCTALKCWHRSVKSLLAYHANINWRARWDVNVLLNKAHYLCSAQHNRTKWYCSMAAEKNDWLWPIENCRLEHTRTNFIHSHAQTRNE